MLLVCTKGEMGGHKSWGESVNAADPACLRLGPQSGDDGGTYGGGEGTEVLEGFYQSGRVEREMMWLREAYFERFI